MSKYSEGKEKARQEAIEWQASFAENDYSCYSWEEMAEWQDHFARLAVRYGLVKEFRENGII